MEYTAGKSRKINLPNGEEHVGVYAIVDLDDIKASHNEITFADTPGYPLNSYGQNLNDRNYKDDLSAQNNVRKIAENLNPENLIALSSTPSGTPIINRQGIVVSGNNRVMSLKLAQRNYPKNYAAYKNQLAEDLPAFGIPSHAMQWVDNPVLIRFDESLPFELTTEDLAKYNQDTKKGERPVDRAIKYSNILLTNERCRNIIVGIIDGYETFSDLYSPTGYADRKKIIETMVQCGLIPEAQLPLYYDGKDFTEAGKDFLEMLLCAIVLTPDAIKVSNSDGVKRIRQIIISSLPVLITNENLKEGSLKDNFSNALLIQYKINQVGDFSDYIRSQTLFAEEKFDEKSLYVYALLRKGRNEFKDAIKKYNDAIRENSGASLFGSSNNLSVSEIFDLVIKSRVDEADKKLISLLFADNKSQEAVIKKIDNDQDGNGQLDIDLPPLPQITENMVNIVEETVADPELLFNGNWFKLHPEKVLGEAYETSGRYGKVTKYRGTIDALERIDTPVNFIGNERIMNNPLLSTAADFNLSGELLSPDNEEFVKGVIEKATRQNVDKSTRKKKAEIVQDDTLVGPTPALQTFEDVYRTYNLGITKEETAAFLYYKTQTGKPLSRRWINLVQPGKYERNLSMPEPFVVDDAVLEEWVRHGVLYYYEGNLLPAPLYLSGNMYDKKLQLDRDKDDIVAKYGNDVYDAQLLKFNEAWKQVYDRRLTINSTANTLVILPISKFANEFMVTRIVSMAEEAKFKIKQVTSGTDKRFGKPDWEKDPGTSEYKRDVFEELPLVEAFGFWMFRFNPELKQPTTYFEIFKYYCLGSPIYIRPVNDSKEAKMEADAKKEKIKSVTQAEGERLFALFLDTELEPNDKVRAETQWNANYNNYKPVDYTRIPVAFNMCRYYKGAFERLLPEKREAVAFMLATGSGCLSYDVGVGKTPSCIFTLSAFLDAGLCSRPLLTVPNQVYKQFISEIKGFAPHIPVIEGYNLSAEYVENFKDVNGNIALVPDGTITVITYEGLEQIGFTESTQADILDTLYDILNQGGESERAMSKKQKAGFQERLETLVGRGLKGTLFNIEDFGFDFMAYDEAHKGKKVFTAVKGEETEDKNGKVSRARNPYAISSGTPSSMALKMFMLNYYVQHKNEGGNVLLLTATPFTNSPLEIFSMLTMLAYQELRQTDLKNIKTFFDTYVKTSTSLTVNSRLRIQYRQVILGFNNLISMQTLIRRYINYKTGEDVNVQRPKKYVLPYTHKIDDGIVTRLGENEKVETYLAMTTTQAGYMKEILEYAEGKTSTFDNLDLAGDEVEEDEESGNITDTEATTVSMGALSSSEKAGVRAIKALNYAQSLAISPHLYVRNRLAEPTYKTYVEMSPKILYTMRCIASVKAYHESRNEAVSGQIIYMDRGVEYFNLLKEYLVKVIGFKEHEVGIIVSGLPKNGKRSKEYVKNLFNGEIYNESTKVFDLVSDDERIKVIIGSSTIREGVNAQRYGTVLYDLHLDWNPTDLQQLEGRIYRQGNTFNAVRIVFPLLLDSADIFIFQKLQEKTARINTIWATDGKSNSLDTQEFNPEELKFALVRDPKIIADLRSIEEKTKIENEILGYNRQIEIANSLIRASNVIDSNFSSLRDGVLKYRNFVSSGDILQDAQALVKMSIDVDKKQTDKEGRPLISSSERRTDYRYWESQSERQARLDRIKIASPLDPYYKPYYLSEMSMAVRTLMSGQVIEFLRTNKIRFTVGKTGPLESFIGKVEKEIENLKKQKEHFDTAEFKESMIAQIEEERRINKIEYKPLDAVVADFGKLNYLLSDKKVKPGKPLFTSCPPLNAAGERLTDPVALKYLDDCILHEGQTKDIWYEVQNHSYSAARQELHKKIIDGLFEQVKCVRQGAPIAVLTGGSPASGKSTYLKKMAPYLLKPDVFHLDADEIRAQLPEYKGWNANTTHRETQDIVNDLLNNIGSEACRYDLVYDGTMNKAQKYFPLVNKLRGLGYKVFIIFMDIPYGIARQRALDRYKHTGRYVPMEVIDDFFKIVPGTNKTMGQTALDELKSIVDGYIVIDGISGEIIGQGGESLPDSRMYAGTVGQPELIETTLPVSEQKEVTEQDVRDAIEVLQLLADDGNKDAIDAIEALNLLLS